MKNRLFATMWSEKGSMVTKMNQLITSKAGLHPKILLVGLERHCVFQAPSANLDK